MKVEGSEVKAGEDLNLLGAKHSPRVLEAVPGPTVHGIGTTVDLR